MSRTSSRDRLFDSKPQKAKAAARVDDTVIFLNDVAEYGLFCDIEGLPCGLFALDTLGRCGKVLPNGKINRSTKTEQCSRLAHSSHPDVGLLTDIDLNTSCPKANLTENILSMFHSEVALAGGLKRASEAVQRPHVRLP